MSLSLYNKKRHFDKTAEPRGKERSSKGALRFVVQKHDASHLHYDFRLEMDGVLKSWAVPKGPSLDPSDKRLAMMVEDHPLDYRNFEGIIPEGNYGGGTVIVWDEGTYEPLEGEGKSRKETEKELLRQLYSGNLKIRLHGKKLRGDFALFQMKGRGERSWILNKKKDAYSAAIDVLAQDESVKTGKTIAEVAADHGTVPNHPEPPRKGGKKSAPQKGRAEKPAQAKASPSKPKDIRTILGAAAKRLKKTPMPQEASPMLATLVNAPFDSAQWLYEIKWDGYRALAYTGKGATELISRNGKSFAGKYAAVAEALSDWGVKAVLDGEIVAVDEKGLAVFQLLQNSGNTAVRLQFFVFDILWLEGYDLTTLPLLERKRILAAVLPPDDAVLRYSDHVLEKGKAFFDAALSKGLEGIMAKKADSLYEPGMRTDAWVKIKVNMRQEVVIAGYTAPRNTRQYFGSLLLGLYDGDDLVYVGHTGSGFNKKSLEAIYKKLQPLVTEKSPFARQPKTNMPATWVRPKLVCEIKFTEWTADRMARHPIFMGLRVDKKPRDVVFEKQKTMATIKKAGAAKKAAQKTVARKPAAKKSATKKSAATKKKAGRAASKKGSSAAASAAGGRRAPGKVKTSGRQIDVDGADEQLVAVDGHELKLTNPGKLYWKKEGFRKGDLVNYYFNIAPYILPYLLNRPQSLNRHPNGIDAPNFFQKDMRGKLPGWIQTHEDFSESTDTHIEYLVCTNEASLIYMANLGCIEINPWHSRSESWQQPDWCLIDLDPDKGNTFEQVMDVAKVVKQVLDTIGASCCVKTSGSTGIHIYIPLGGKYSFEQSKQLAELVVTMVQQELPQLTSIERSPAKRKGMIYLDFLQNRETQTAAAPYSLRPKPGVPVSTPLDWTELKKGLLPTTYHARNIFDRLKVEGDLFAPVLGKGIQLDKVIRKLSSLL